MVDIDHKMLEVHCIRCMCLFFFFNDTATTEIYTLSLHDALPICRRTDLDPLHLRRATTAARPGAHRDGHACEPAGGRRDQPDRKSTRLNSSHANISYAVFCLKKKKHNTLRIILTYPTNRQYYTQTW